LRAKPSAGAEWNGWFQAAFRVKEPGDYRLDLHIPETGDVLPGKFTVKESDPELDNTQPDFQNLYQLASSMSDVEGRLDPDGQRKLEDTLRATAGKLVGLTDSTETPRLLFDLESAHLIPSFMGSDTRSHRNKGKMEDQWDKGLVIPQGMLETIIRTTRMVFLLIGMLMLVVIGVAWLFDKPLRKLLLATAIIFLVQLPIWVVTQLPREWVLPSGLTPPDHDGTRMVVRFATEADERVLVLSYVLLIVVALLALEWMTRKLLRLA